MPRVVHDTNKDVVYYITREEQDQPTNVQLPELEPEPGLILPDGSINWGCPCLGSMTSGPCAAPFREAFSCFHYSTADPKGSDCYEKFTSMQECMSQYPELYARDEDDGEDELGAALAEAEGGGGDAPASNSTATQQASAATQKAPAAKQQASAVTQKASTATQQVSTSASVSAAH